MTMFALEYAFVTDSGKEAWSVRFPIAVNLCYVLLWVGCRKKHRNIMVVESDDDFDDD